MKRLLALVLPLALVACHDTHEPLNPDPLSSSHSVASAPEGRYLPGQILARFEPGAAAAAIAAAHGARLRDELLHRGLWVLDVSEGNEIAVARALARRADVIYAEPDWLLSTTPCELSGGCPTLNDPFWGRKWDLHNDGHIRDGAGTSLATTGKADADIDWLEAYAHLGANFSGSAVIGILDTGIRNTHEDLNGKVQANRNFYSHFGGNVNANDWADRDGHGTHVAAIAAAYGNNGKGVAGVGYGNNIKLINARVCGTLGCPTSAIANGIRWAADNGANILNLSLGGPSAQAAIQDALQYAAGKNVLAICASGNDGKRGVSWPAAFPECVAVGSTTWSDTRASYSNWGPEIELAAPGGDSNPQGTAYSYIASAYYEADNSYVYMAGTSMASPQVAGLAGLLYATGVTNRDAIRTRLQQSADQIGSGTRNEEFGFGRINAYRAVTAGSPPPSPNPPAAPTGLSASAASTSQIDLSWTDNASNESGFRIERCLGSGCTNFALLATVGARSGTGTVNYSDTGLQANTSYSYRVRAYNGDGESNPSNTASATTHEETPPPGQGPTASFTYSCGNSDTCQFTDTSTPGSTQITGWSWAFPNANPGASTNRNPSTTFLSAGSHTVTLVVSSASGQDTATAVVTCTSHPRQGVRCR